MYTPATAEAFATYGVIDDGRHRPAVLAPTGVIPQFGGLEVTTSSTALQALTDAVLYLADYPYAVVRRARLAHPRDRRRCATCSTRSTRRACPAPPSSTPRSPATSPGSSRCRTTTAASPYWAARPAVRAVQLGPGHPRAGRRRGAGYAVPDGVARPRRSTLLADIEQHIPAELDGPDARDSCSAYALNVRTLAGDRDPAEGRRRCYDEAGDDLPLDALAWLWPVVDDAGDRAPRSSRRSATVAATPPGR